MSLSRQQRDWNDLAELDPLWAIASADEHRHGKWDVKEFLQTGEQEIAAVLEKSSKLGFKFGRERSLDFGCGVGRLTRAMAGRFAEATGVDISDGMILQARALNQDMGKCRFLVNTAPDLRVFSDGFFDFVYTNQVLQHLPDSQIVQSYISELVRVLKKGGLLVFQMPAHIRPLYRLQPRRRLYHLLRAMGLSAQFLYRRLGLFPITYLVIPEADILALLKQLGAHVIDVERASVGVTSNRVYFVSK
jgi:ubiquinone/menaquinone biosynthesis C-methylase UbiE